MQTRHNARIQLIAVLLLAAGLSFGFLTQKRYSFTEKGLAATGEWVYFNPATYNVVVYSTSPDFDGATATVETIVDGRPGKETKIKDVSVPGLVLIAAETEWEKISLGAGWYRLRIDTPGAETSLAWHGRETRP